MPGAEVRVPLGSTLGSGEGFVNGFVNLLPVTLLPAAGGEGERAEPFARTEFAKHLCQREIKI